MDDTNTPENRERVAFCTCGEQLDVTAITLVPQCNGPITIAACEECETVAWREGFAEATKPLDAVIAMCKGKLNAARKLSDAPFIRDSVREHARKMVIMLEEILAIAKGGIR